MDVASFYIYYILLSNNSFKIRLYYYYYYYYYYYTLMTLRSLFLRLPSQKACTQLAVVSIAFTLYTNTSSVRFMNGTWFVRAMSFLICLMKGHVLYMRETEIILYKRYTDIHLIIFLKGVSHNKIFRQLAGNIVTLKPFSIKL